MNPLNFDMDALRSMVVGVELGGFTHAALRLNRSASAVSMQLRKLEAAGGQRLFKRNGRGLALTDAGDIVLKYARRVLAVNDEMGVALGAVVKGGVVRVGIPQDFADAALQTLLARFRRRIPRLTSRFGWAGIMRLRRMLLVDDWTWRSDSHRVAPETSGESHRCHSSGSGRHHGSGKPSTMQSYPSCASKDHACSGT